MYKSVKFCLIITCVVSKCRHENWYHQNTEKLFCKVKNEENPTMVAQGINLSIVSLSMRKETNLNALKNGNATAINTCI